MGSFNCGHPRTPENSNKTGLNGSSWRFCNRMRRMVVENEQRQARINAGLPADGRTSPKWAAL